MKTAEEYMVKYRLMSKNIISTDSSLAEDSLIGLNQLKKILAEHDQELAEKIMDLMKVDMMNEGEPHIWNQALTEVLNLLEIK